jgi:hypothetical protein
VNGENPRDGFDVFVIDPATRTVEQVELEPAAPATSEIRNRKPASRARPTKRRLVRKVAKKVAEKAVKKSQRKRRAAKKRRTSKTMKRVAKPAAGTKNLSPLKRRARPKKEPVRATQQNLPAPLPAPLEPSAAGAIACLAGGVPVDEVQSMMVLELRPPDRQPPRQGTIDIRLVDVR